jgi:hypothetical protein
MQTPQKTQTKIDQFVTALLRGITCFEEAGRILVELLDEEGPTVLEDIRAKNPRVITESVLETFERIGRKQLYYQLSVVNNVGTRALSRCPYSEQVKYFDSPLELLTATGDTLLVSVDALTSDQAKQVIGPKRVRTLGEQRAYLESLKRKPQPLGKREPYTVKHGRITFHEPCTLTVSEMARLISEASNA